MVPLPIAKRQGGDSDRGFPSGDPFSRVRAKFENKGLPMNTADMKRVETHLKRTFNTGGIILKPRGKPNDSCEVYVGDEFIGVVFEDEDEAGSFMFEMAILAEDLPQD